MFGLGGRGRKRRRVKMGMKMELRKISSISCWCTVSSLSARKVQTLKRASDSGVGDEDPAANVSRSGSQSANEQSLSTLVNLPNVASFTAVENSLPGTQHLAAGGLHQPYQEQLLKLQPHLTPATSLPNPLKQVSLSVLHHSPHCTQPLLSPTTWDLPSPTTPTTNTLLTHKS